jgi:hypothetical protein
MARKKKDTQGANAAPETTTTTKEAEASSEPIVTILKTAQATKLSPRGDETRRLTYRVGRMGDTILLQLFANTATGRFSKEWTGVKAIRNSLAQLPKGVQSFKGALALKSAMVGRSSCNSGFLACVLKAEGVFVADADPKKKGMLMLASPEAIDQWEASILVMPVPKDAEQVLLNPPKAKPFFQKKKDDAAAGDAPVADDVEPVEEAEPVDAGGDADQDDDA